MNACYIGYEGSKNLGDDIQTLALIQMFGYPTGGYVSRADLSKPPESVTRVIVNGWLAPQHLPPAPGWEVCYMGAFMNGRACKQIPEGWDVGACDRETAALLRKHGRAGFYSGCASLQFRRWIPHSTSGPVVVNIDGEIPNALRDTLGDRLISASQMLSEEEKAGLPLRLRLRKARMLLELYQSASLVISSRLHAILPCVAMHVPLVPLVPQFATRRMSSLPPSFPWVTEEGLLRSCRRWSGRYEPFNFDRLIDRKRRWWENLQFKLVS